MLFVFVVQLKAEATPLQLKGLSPKLLDVAREVISSTWNHFEPIYFCKEKQRVSKKKTLGAMISFYVDMPTGMPSPAALEAMLVSIS